MAVGNCIADSSSSQEVGRRGKKHIGSTDDAGNAVGWANADDG